METVPQFFIRFQNLRKQLTRSPTMEELTELFLTKLWEPLRITLAVADLTGKPIEDVISRVLRLDSAQSMSMTSLQCALLDEEETSFRKAVQCTTCPNPRHSSLECTLRTLPHLPLELYEYNLLNWNTVPVWQIEPQPA